MHVSFSTVALSLVTCISLDINVNYELLAFIFFCTVTGYNFVKYAEVAGLHHRSLATSLKTIQVFSFFCGFGMLLTAFLMPLEVWVVCGILGLITLLYAVPFFLPAKNSTSRKGNLRSISGFKIYIIGIVWASVTVVLPVLENGLFPYTDMWIVFVQRFLFIIAIMIPFEIRDLAFDDTSLKTLPQVLGIKKAKIISVLWLVLSGFLEFFKDDFLIASFYTHSLVLLLLTVCITLSQKRIKTDDYFASFWVEGIPLFWLGLVLITSY